MGWEMGGSFKREGTYVCLWLTHVNVWQKQTEYCKAIILQLKTNLKDDSLCYVYFTTIKKADLKLSI